MTTAPPIAPSSSVNVYAAFQSVLEVLKIRPKEQVHYHRWVDSWMKSGGLVSAEETRRFFDGLLSRSHVSDWQLVQAAHAVRLCVCEVLKCAWAATFDWFSLEREAVALGSGAAKVSQVSRQVAPAVVPRIKVSNSRAKIEGQQAGRPASDTAGTAVLLSTNPKPKFRNGNHGIHGK